MKEFEFDKQLNDLKSVSQIRKKTSILLLSYLKISVYVLHGMRMKNNGTFLLLM